MFDIGDIVAVYFQNNLVGDHYLIIDDQDKNTWLVLSLEKNKISSFLKKNMNSLCKKVA